MNVGGYWEYNALSGLYVVIPAEKLSDFPEFEDHTPRVLDEPPSDAGAKAALGTPSK